ncbi:type II toxin-antitoxin system antitoxin SocA domain-containing protein [Halobacteriovorax sp. RZ-1]|uniref:Panacea domain-containing protein n=1 Tax=unclassified Halobacteriovorax TaxID=2639665 RepID=UPI0037248C22
MEMTPAIRLAHWIYNYCEANNISDLSNIKMQKLLYYCSGIASALELDEIEPVEFSAWKYGPVNSECYQEFKSFGANAINFSSANVNYSENTENILNAIMSIYVGLTPFELVEQTHSEEPWRKTWNSEEEFIPNALIKKYFKDHYQLGNSRVPSIISNDGFFTIDNIPVKRFNDIFEVATFVQASGNV